MRPIDADALLRDIEKYHLSDGMFQHWVQIQPTIEQEKCEDTVSRNAVIQKLNTMDRYVSEELRLCDTDKIFPKNEVFIVDDVYEEIVEDLPSAQPEIIRCTECKHYREYDSKYVENAVVVQCMADRYPISETIPDGWFCAGAERKDDE